MAFKTFVGESGLKVLAMARLSQCEYSVMLYLLNCAASGLDELITTERELATLIGYDEPSIHKAGTTLGERNLIKIRHGDSNGHQPPGRQSICVGIQYDISAWHLNFEADVTSQDAIVFPFRRGALQLVAKPKKEPVVGDKKKPTWKRVIDSYRKERDIDDNSIDRIERDARILVDTHPVDQVLIMLRHFGRRIPTLSLLASSWRHYQELFEEETMRVDMQGARKKHIELDNQLRKDVEEMLGRIVELALSDEEKTVLEILSNHNHPRRQLFWAFQTRSRYPNLKEFFTRNASIMLPITSTGHVMKKKPHQDSKT